MQHYANYANKLQARHVNNKSTASSRKQEKAVSDLMSVQDGLGPGPGVNVGGSWGPQGLNTGQKRTYSSITAINTSVRDKKNVLEVRLERQQGASFKLSQLEVETLLVRLGIDGSQFEGVSACPEGKPVVLITLHPTVNINRFLHRNESYVVKEGVRTTTIRSAGRKDVLVTVFGLHPNTKDQAVIRYLEAHGKVSTSEKVIHHVFPGAPGSTLCAGKLNGNRSHVMDLKIPLESYHIIDGEKVTIRYPGQEWTCARCHQLKSVCPGLAIARDCTAERVLLSSHMEAHWKKIGFKPEIEADSEVNDLPDLDIQVGHSIQKKPIVQETNLQSKYKSVIIKGFAPELSVDDALKVISENGLPPNFNKESVTRNIKTGVFTICDLMPEQCLVFMEKMHAKKFLGRKIFVTSVVENSPKKTNPAADETTLYNSASPTTGNTVIPELLNGTTNNSKILPKLSSPVLDPKAASVLAASKTSDCQSSCLEEFEFDPPLKGVSNNSPIENPNFNDMIELTGKRKASLSPEAKELSKKEKKAAKREQKVKNRIDQRAKLVIEVSPKKI